METEATGESLQDGDDLMTDADGTSTPEELRRALYARCATQEEGKVFDQDDLLSFGIVPDNDVHQLMDYTHKLSKEGLFKLMKQDGKVCWRVVKKADAAKYKSLSADQALVYSYIESSSTEGIWSKSLRSRTNLHAANMNYAIKALEGKKYIKSIKSIRYPSRKVYILANLQPSEDVTGGPFYTDGALDTEFIRHMSWWTERYIVGRSWWFPPIDSSSKRKSNSKMSQRQAEEARALEFARRGPGRERSRHMRPMPPEYNNYPTTAELTSAINASELSGVKLRTSEMQQLIDVLCWDDRLEKVNDGKAYRATRVVATEINGLTEAPCGLCPVFDFCEEGGPVSAKTCEYFKDWLEF